MGEPKGNRGVRRLSHVAPITEADAMRHPDARHSSGASSASGLMRERKGPIRRAAAMRGRAVALALLTLVGAQAAPAAAQNPASAPDDVTFEQNGETVTGNVEMPDIQGVQSAEITDGRYVDGTLTFVLRVGAGDQMFSAEVEADVRGDEMVGEAQVVGLQQTAVFRAQRVG
jgi:hypothetical protein